LFLNPDTIIPEDCLEKCIAFFNEKPDTGAVGIKMLDGAGNFLKESKRSFPSPLTSFYKLSGLAALFPKSKEFSKYHLGNLGENEINEVDVLAGAFMMIPKKVLDKTGSFDEDFFMYGEDIDLSYRIQLAGYKNIYFPQTQMLHFKGESTKKGSLNYVKLFYKAMSIFARKHYGSSKAGVFNFFIQLAILIRAFISAAARFIKWIGLPVIDASIILISFWLIKILWSTYVKQEANYSPNMLVIAFPAFTLIFLATAYFSGLYDNGYKQKKLNHSTIFAFLILLSFYSLLPESWRFSRGILVTGCLLAFLLIAIMRKALVKWKVISSAGDDANPQTIIVAAQNEFENINAIMQNARMHERVFGRVALSQIVEKETVGNLVQLPYLIKKYPVSEIIYCAGELSFKKIIEVIHHLPANIKNKIHAEGSKGIVGSESKESAGKIVADNAFANMLLPANKRNKKIADIIISMFFILSFPVHVLVQKNFIQFYKNVFAVLIFKKTWIGAASQASNFFLKPAILTTTGLPQKLNTLPPTSLEAADVWYANDFSIWQDIKMVFKGYRFLSA
jgi:GT2 family glycosyltransferase